MVTILKRKLIVIFLLGEDLVIYFVYMQKQKNLIKWVPNFSFNQWLSQIIYRISNRMA